MDRTTKMVSEYVKSKGINVAKMSRDTGILYSSLYQSLLSGHRNIRGEELLKVCKFLSIEPMQFLSSS